MTALPDEAFDYIIVGSGAAGAVIAARLSENPDTTVLLLELGPDDKSIYVAAAGGFIKVLGTERTFLFRSEPEPGMNGRSVPLVQGRTLGGGTSVNGMLYVRGQREDYDAWRDAGCVGWGFDDVLPYFRKCETNVRLSGQYHGTDGPMTVSDGQHRQELCYAFVKAAQETSLPDGRSIPYNDDFNGERQDGVGFYQTMTRLGERSSTARTYLKDAARRKNLEIRVNSSVSRILIENGRAVGVAITDKSGRAYDVRARREVVLCAGAFGTPKLLMLSGIGPGAHLSSLGIPVMADVKAIGEGYQDHVHVAYDAALKAPIGLFGQDKGLNMIRNGLHWLLFRGGLLASNVVEAGGFVDFDGDGRPEIQFNAYGATSTGWGDPPVMDHRISFAPFLITCHSRGRVTLRSRDPADHPRVLTNLLTDQRDVDALVNGLQLARRILTAPSMARYAEEETIPGPDVANDPASLEAYVRQTAKTGLHPVGTCAMGPGDDAPVDLRLRLKAVDGLRIADGSVIPAIMRGNTTAPIMMIGERAAEFIRGNA